MKAEGPAGRVEVLRLGHRPDRDKRITTHVALVARAFGASSIHVDTRDPKLERTVNDITERFGGDFRIDTGTTMRSVLRKWKGTVVHLTMYGRPLEESIEEIPDGEDVLVVVGAEKVPAEIYDLAHLNIAVGNQPHSEVAALALFLERSGSDKEKEDRFGGGRMVIHPSNTGKLVSEKGSGEPFSGEKDPFAMEWPPVPDREQCLELLGLLGASRSVMIHVKEVCRLGLDMVSESRKAGNDQDIDMELLQAGLLLHDLGRTRTHSIRHVTVGAELSKRLGLDPRVTSIIHNHPGAGVPGDEAATIGLPYEDHIPKTLEEKIVCHSDNLVGSSRRRPLSVPVKKLMEKGAVGAAERMKDLHSELEKTLGIDIDLLIFDQ